jgi:hypothetical protein
VVTDADDVAANFDLSKFNKVPLQIAARFRSARVQCRDSDYYRRKSRLRAMDLEMMESAEMDSRRRILAIHAAELSPSGRIGRAKDPDPDLVRRRTMARRDRELGISRIGASTSRTKRVDGENLTSECFLWVGDPERTETWALPWRFSSEEKTESHLRDALARFDQEEKIPASEKPAVYDRLLKLCKEHGITPAIAEACRRLSMAAGGRC